MLRLCNGIKKIRPGGKVDATVQGAALVGIGLRETSLQTILFVTSRRFEQWDTRLGVLFSPKYQDVQNYSFT
jgi:hypothetical protein